MFFFFRNDRFHDHSGLAFELSYRHTPLSGFIIWKSPYSLAHFIGLNFMYLSLLNIFLSLRNILVTLLSRICNDWHINQLFRHNLQNSSFRTTAPSNILSIILPFKPFIELIPFRFLRFPYVITPFSL